MLFHVIGTAKAATVIGRYARKARGTYNLWTVWHNILTNGEAIL